VLITAQFNASCRVCGGPIRRGETILWAKNVGSRHPGCADPEPPVTEDELERLLRRGRDWGLR
jgi:hypothetical protein